MQTQPWAIALVVFGGIIGAFGPIFLKKASSTINLKDWRTVFFNKNLITGVVIYGISAVIFIPALKGGDLSVLYPLVGLAYVWVSIYSRFLLGEKMNLTKWTGIILILLGVSFIGFGA